MSFTLGGPDYSQIAAMIGLDALRTVYPALTGAGVTVGQVEASPVAGSNDFEPDPSQVGQSPTNADGFFVYFNGLASTATPNDGTIGGYSSHATVQAGFFYGDALYQGEPTGVAYGVAHVDVYFADNFLANLSTPAFAADKVVNMSFVYDPGMNEDTWYDTAANTFGNVFVAAAGNSGVPASPSTAYNVISVDSSVGIDAIGPASNGEAKPDISAPQDVTSRTAAIVSGAATLLMQAGMLGYGGKSMRSESDAEDFRTIKALLLNGAVKPADYYSDGFAPTESDPLNQVYGAGVVNVYNSVSELSAGEVAPNATVDATLNTPGFVALSAGTVTQSTGWTLQSLSTSVGLDAIDEYGFVLPAGANFEATLTWAAHNDNTIDDLGLYLYSSTGALVAHSASTQSSVQQIDAAPGDSGGYVLEVRLRGSAVSTVSDRYALAFAVTNPGRTLSWTGDGAGTAFGAATNWNDDTDGSIPAQTPPDPTDTVQFNSGGGAITGTGTVATINVGSTGSGVLELSTGASLMTGSLDTGVIAGAVGQIGMTGPGTELAVTGNATVADDGTGVLSVLSGATFAAASLTIGSRRDSSGVVIVSGSGSALDISGALNIGTALGTGSLTVGPSAAVHASSINQQGQVVLEGGLLDPTVHLIGQSQTVGGYGTLEAGDIIDEGAIQASGTQHFLLVRGTILGGGTLVENGTLLGSAPAGQILIDAGGTVELTGPVLNAASTMVLDPLTPANTYTVTNSAIDVSFSDASEVLLLDDIAGFGGTVTAFTGGDQFVIAEGVLSGLGVSNGNTLTFSDSGPRAGTGGVDRIFFGAPVNTGQFGIVNGNTVQAVACFAEGTRIGTVDGMVRVEDLAVGHQVATADGRVEPVVWIGKRDVDCFRRPNPETVWPVRVRAGAFGENVPIRDLYLSPDHAVFVNDVLVPVNLLVNGTSIGQVKWRKVTYFHIELPRHEVILAEALAVESYLDLDERVSSDRSNNAIRLFADSAARRAPATEQVWETRATAPLAMTGARLAKARAVVARCRETLIATKSQTGETHRDGRDIEVLLDDGVTRRFVQNCTPEHDCFRLKQSCSTPHCLRV